MIGAVETRSDGMIYIDLYWTACIYLRKGEAGDHVGTGSEQSADAGAHGGTRGDDVI